MSTLFFDMDGVMNDGRPQANGYCGVKAECVAHFNSIVAAVPGLRLVVSSSWRYLVHNGSCTLDGLTNLLLVCGLDVYGRIDGITVSEEEMCGGPVSADYLKEHGDRLRREQIYLYAREHGIENFVVLDDRDLGMPEQVMTQGDVGLTAGDAERAIARLRAGLPSCYLCGAPSAGEAEVKIIDEASMGDRLDDVRLPACAAHAAEPENIFEREWEAYRATSLPVRSEVAA